MLTIWSLVPLPFLNPDWISGSSWLIYCWNLAWRILSITFLACEMSAQRAYTHETNIVMKDASEGTVEQHGKALNEEKSSSSSCICCKMSSRN